jgi:hypothetical protein
MSEKNEESPKKDKPKISDLLFEHSVAESILGYVTWVSPDNNKIIFYDLKMKSYKPIKDYTKFLGIIASIKEIRKENPTNILLGIILNLIERHFQPEIVDTY